MKLNNTEKATVSLFAFFAAFLILVCLIMKSYNIIGLINLGGLQKYIAIQIMPIEVFRQKAEKEKKYGCTELS